MWIFLSGFCLFLFFESIVRFLSPTLFFTGDAYYSPQPFYVFSGEPDKKIKVGYKDSNGKNKIEEITFSPLGFRLPTPTKIKPANEYRIFVLGGSTVFNGFPIKNSITGQLERQFHADGFTFVKVYNFGAVSFVSGQELSLIIHKLVDYQPDMLIVYDGGNDIHIPLKYDPRPGYPYNYLVFESGYDFIRMRTNPFKVFLLMIINKSQLGRLIFKEKILDTIIDRGEKREKVEYRTQKWEKSVIDSYISNLLKMSKVANGFGFKLFVFFQPTIFEKNIKSHEEMPLSNDASPFDTYMKRQYQMVRQEIKRLDKKGLYNTEFEIVDLSQVFLNNPQTIYYDFIHVFPKGNEIISHKIYTHVRSKVNLNKLKLSHRKNGHF
jgi:hypothetical protein